MPERVLSPKQAFFRVLGWSQVITLFIMACVSAYGDWRLTLFIGFSTFIPTLLLAALAAYLVRPQPPSGNVSKMLSQTEIPAQAEIERVRSYRGLVRNIWTFASFLIMVAGIVVAGITHRREPGIELLGLGLLFLISPTLLLGMFVRQLEPDRDWEVDDSGRRFRVIGEGRGTTIEYHPIDQLELYFRRRDAARQQSGSS